MANVNDAIATMTTRLEAMMGVLQMIAQKSDATENTLQSIAQRVTALESPVTASTQPASPGSVALEGAGVLPVLPEPPAAAIPPVPAAAPAAPSPSLPAMPPSTPEAGTQGLVSTPAPTMSLMAALTALANTRQVPRTRTDTSEEDSSIGYQDPDISMMYPNMDDEQYGSNPAHASKSRKSLLMREQDRAEKVAKEIQYTRAAPAFDAAKLANLTPWKVLQFWVAVLEYQTCYLLKLNVASYISQSVKDAIVARFPELLPDKINHLKDIELQNYTIKMIQPRTKAEFYRKLGLAVRFNNDVVLKPNAEHFGLFYAALLTYKVTFTRMYDFLSRDNPNAVPECTMHPGGLIKLFLSKIPHGYGMNVHNNMSTKKFDDIIPYITAFYKCVQRHYEIHLTTTELNDCFTGTAAEVFNKSKITPGLHHIVADDADDADEAWVDRLHEQDQEEDAADTTYHPAVAEAFDAVEDMRHFEATLAAMTNTAGSKKDMACFTKLLHGTCNKQGCTYAHSEKLCNETRTLFIDMMRKVQRPAATGPAFRSPLPPSAPKPAFTKPKLNAVAEEEEEN